MYFPDTGRGKEERGGGVAGQIRRQEEGSVDWQTRAHATFPRLEAAQALNMAHMNYENKNQRWPRYLRLSHHTICGAGGCWRVFHRVGCRALLSCVRSALSKFVWRTNIPDAFTLMIFMEMLLSVQS